MSRFRFRQSSLVFSALAAMAVTTPVRAQVITGLSSYSYSNASATTFGGWFTNTQGGDFPSNTYITVGTDPSTDPLVYNGNAAGNLLTGIGLSAGTYTFHLWGYTGYQPNHGVSLMFGGDNTTPLLSAYYTTSGHTLSGLGLPVYDDFGNATTGAGLSAVVNGFTVSIAEWSPVLVHRNNWPGSYQWIDWTNNVDQSVGKLVLRVESAATVVPEPSSFVLMAIGGAGLLVAAKRRRTA